jgi:hypothetical protein
MEINNEFSIGQMVFLVTDLTQTPHIVIAIEVTGTGKKEEIVYILSLNGNLIRCYGIELTANSFKL